LALLVASDMAGQRAAEHKRLSNWRVVPFMQGQLLTVLPALKLGIAMLPRQARNRAAGAAAPRQSGDG
jgi:hypothetical protein